jgi:hypothetical protein
LNSTKDTLSIYCQGVGCGYSIFATPTRQFEVEHG